MPNYADLTSIAANTQDKAVLLRGDSIAFLLTALGEYLEYHFNWRGSGEFGLLTDNESDDVDAIIAKTERALMGNLTGTIIMSAVPVAGALECDGSRYTRADYPELWAKIKEAVDLEVCILEVDETYFFVPDLINRFPLGGVPSGYMDGESEHTLTADEMPIHTHTEIIAVETFINGGLEAPAAAATAFEGVTGSSGGGLAHNNVPPFTSLRFFIWT